MANQDVWLKPHAIRGTKTAWWYEEDHSICVVQQHWGASVHISTVYVTIPWAALRSALQRTE